jgi:hypothetical protein
VLPITTPALRSRLELAWRSDGPLSPAARALIAHTRSGMIDEFDQEAAS